MSPQPASTLKEAAAWTLDLCARIAAITDVPGTITRTFLSPRTHAVHALLRAEMEAVGVEARTDAIGNVRGLYAGVDPGAPVLLLGSHIDTVLDAGAYDGVLGVACALALLRLLGGRRLPFAIELMAFSEEEGIRFRQPFLGSLAWTGALTPTLLGLTDAQGISVAAAVRAFGLDPTRDDARMTPGTFAFLELHLEQGPVLESLDLPLGLVTAIAGQSRFELTFTGQANHAGTTPMTMRADALVAASLFVVEAAAFAELRVGLVATVGRLEVQPGAVNIVPGTVLCSLDVRHADDHLRELAAHDLLGHAERIAVSRGVRLQVVQTSRQSAVAMHPGLCAALGRALGSAGFPPHRMVSGAGHDAMVVANTVATAMLFLRTPGGLSHHPDEAVAAADVQAALTVCLHLLESLEPANLAYPLPLDEATR